MLVSIIKGEIKTLDVNYAETWILSGEGDGVTDGEILLVRLEIEAEGDNVDAAYDNIDGCS